MTSGRAVSAAVALVVMLSPAPWTPAARAGDARLPAPPGSPPHASTPPAAAASGDESIFRAVRAAETEGDTARLRALASDGLSQRARDRVALAVEAVELRSAARTDADAIKAERDIEHRRAALIERCVNDAPGCARELALESAEDLLLRLLTIGFRDTLVAVGLPTADELTDAEALRNAADARLRGPVVAPLLAESAAIATDAAVFRAHALKALALLLDADLSQCRAEGLADGAGAPADANARTEALGRASAKRAEALRLLERASLCELPVPKALGELLALARARAEATPERRGALLTKAATASDQATAFVARVVRWSEVGGGEEFPTIASAGPAGNPSAELLARIACTAELRARLARRASAVTLSEPIGRLLRSSASSTRDRVASTVRLRSATEWLAARLPSALRELAMRDDAPPALFAAAALAHDGARVIDAAPAAAERAARDALVGPVIALRVAEQFAARHDAAAAARVILESVRAFEGMPSAREALDIALDIRRAGGDAAALDAALELALGRFPRDADGTVWQLERIDLALFGPDGLRDSMRAASLLAALPSNQRGTPEALQAELRRIELAFAAVAARAQSSSAAAREKSARDAAELARDAAELDVPAQPSATSAAARRLERTLPARLAVVRAELALLAADPLRACLLAERAFADSDADGRSALRAAEIWIDAALASGKPVELPPLLRARAAQSEPLRATTARTLARLVDETEAALAARAHPKTLPGSIEALATIVGEGGGEFRAVALRAQAVGRLAALDREGARSFAREALKASPDDRLAQWVLAEVLRTEADAASRAEAFGLFRALSPLAAAERDRFWWRGQLGQLEMLCESGDRAANRADIVARINRLSALDAALGGGDLARRFEAVRRAALDPATEAGRSDMERRTDGQSEHERAPTRGPANRKD